MGQGENQGRNFKPTHDKERQGEAEPDEAREGKRRGRPEKLVKIDDSPRNVARTLFTCCLSKQNSSLLRIVL